MEFFCILLTLDFCLSAGIFYRPSINNDNIIACFFILFTVEINTKPGQVDVTRKLCEWLGHHPSSQTNKVQI